MHRRPSRHIIHRMQISMHKPGPSEIALRAIGLEICPSNGTKPQDAEKLNCNCANDLTNKEFIYAQVNIAYMCNAACVDTGSEIALVRQRFLPKGVTLVPAITRNSN